MPPIDPAKPTALLAIKALAEAQQEAAKHKSSATVLFSDLCDSTSYKFLRGPTAGLVKTYTHNDAITRAVARFNGKVIKYIGDEVMAIFDATADGPTNAINAAIHAHIALQGYNSTHTLTGLDSIITKTGITHGDVWYFKFEGHDLEDPQGSVVDSAARLTALAKPGQILCSGPVNTHCTDPSVLFGEAVQRRLKGIPNPFTLFEVFTHLTNALGVSEVAYVPVYDDMVNKALKCARNSERLERYDEAINHYETILTRDPDYYAPNVLLGRIYQNKKNDPVTARKYLEKAKASNPFAPLARQLLASNRWFAADGKLPLNELDSIIEETNQALSLAEDGLDLYIEVMLRHTLAHFYANRYELSNDDADLEMSVTLCEILDKQIDREKKLQAAAFLDTYAFALSQKHDAESLEKALNLVDEADKMEPRNEYIATTRLRILKKLKAMKRT